MKLKFSTDKITIQTGALPITLDKVELEIEDVTAKDVCEVMAGASILMQSEEDNFLDELMKQSPIVGLGKHFFTSPSSSRPESEEGIEGLLGTLMKGMTSHQPSSDFFQQFGKPKDSKE